jgi:hypothetical protein
MRKKGKSQASCDTRYTGAFYEEEKRRHRRREGE